MKFLELDKKTQIEVCTTPHCVFVTPNPDDETYEQVVKRQEKFLRLPEKTKNKLLSSEVSKKIQNIGKHYGLSLLQMASIARLIRSYYFKEVEKKDFAEVLLREIKIDKAKVDKIVKYVMEAIIEKDEPRKVLTIIKTMPIKLALGKYPEIRDQILSDKPIKLSGKPYPVKGTIGNWIEDYYNIVGANNYDIMKRSRYLYNGENSKELSDYERKKLAILLNSLDKNLPIKIDTEKKEIVFDIQDKTKGGAVVSLKRNGVLLNKTKSDNLLSKKTDKNKKNVFDVIRKRNDYPSAFKSRATNKLQQDAGGNDNKEGANIINTKRGDFSFNSVDFKKATKKKKKIIKKFFGKKKKNDEQGLKKGSKVRFSFSQQFPVEKNKNVRKDYLPKFAKEKKTKNSFFGKISPIDDNF